MQQRSSAMHYFHISNAKSCIPEHGVTPTLFWANEVQVYVTSSQRVIGYLFITSGINSWSSWSSCWIPQISTYTFYL